MADRYSINEIFYSVQGEGVRAGTANVFVRFAGCNLTCKMGSHGFDCDTEFAGGRMLTAVEIFTEAERVGGAVRAVIFTGGEPLLQLDRELMDTFGGKHWFMAVETNGSVPLPAPGTHPLDWVTVSPKVAEHAVLIDLAHEVKYVRHAGQALPKPHCKAGHRLLSPAWTSHGIDREALEWCVKLVKENPTWRLSIQQHKVWRVR